MYIKNLTITNFLSYPVQSVAFSSGLNIITGENASGKTNLIESIYLASIGRSSKAIKDKELINWESKKYARITLDVIKQFSEHSIDIYIDEYGKKRILLDDLPILRLGELMGAINVVYFSPDEIDLIKRSPEDRRRFVDISLSQQNKRYFYSLVKYNQILKQRNKVLKDYKFKPEQDDILSLVDKELATVGAEIVSKRRDFVAYLSPIAEKIHYGLSGDKEHLELWYETDVDLVGDLPKDLANKLFAAREKDKRLEYTTVGPHRDDIRITASGIDLRKFGSQGQKRSAVLSLKLSELEMFKHNTGETPILLLDDVMSELDTDRQHALIAALEGVQVMITCTEMTLTLSSNYNLYLVKDRQVTLTKEVKNGNQRQKIINQ